MIRPARIAGITQLAVLASCFFLTSAVSRAEEPTAEDSTDVLINDGLSEPALEELEPVIVYGGLAVPQMWKVYRGDHVMWVIANRAAPVGGTWRMDEIEARMADSKLVQLPGAAFANPDIGIFKALTLIRSAFKAGKNPDGQTLKDVLPAETYARWRALKTTYVGRDDDIEEWRPSVALSMLEEKIGDKLRPKHASSASRPRTGPMLLPLVEKAAKKKRVKIRTMPRIENKVEMKNIRDMLKSAHKLSLVDEKCVADYVGYLERQVEYWKQPSTGSEDVEAPKRPASCNEVEMYIRKVNAGEMPDSTGFVEFIKRLAVQDTLAKERLGAEWIKAAEAALEKNTSTIAVLSMVNLKGPRSYMDKLRALGYTVEEPPGAP